MGTSLRASRFQSSTQYERIGRRLKFNRGMVLMSEKKAPTLSFQVTRKDSTAVVKLNGRLVAGVHDHLYTHVVQLVPDSKRIVLDLTDLVRVDSMGLGTLVRAYVHCRSAGCSLELVNLGQQVRQLLGMTNLMSVFAVIGEHGIKMS
jgi:anti-sigma B factor antagonist